MDFIKERFGSQHLSKAREQQKQLQYFTQSKIQEEVSEAYLNEWGNRNYRSDDHFLNFVKSIFKVDNFLSFYKYLRFPIASSTVINNVIVPGFKRVFYSEDSFHKYVIKGQETDEPKSLKCDHFNDQIFNAILFNHNDILVHDLKETNKPFRHIIPINDVIAIDSTDSVISKIAFSAKVDEQLGFVYLDEFVYAFYDKQHNLIFSNPHDLGECPADYITPYSFGADPIRRSVFTYVREKLEEYVFLKTLQRMSDPSGLIPVVAKLKTTENKKEGVTTTEVDFPLSSGLAPKPPSSPLQAGTIIEIPMVKTTDGSIDMEIVKNFLNYYHFPVEVLDFINKRVHELETDIIISVLGDYREANEAAKNEMQVSKSFVNKQDRIREFSKIMSRIRTISDYKMLALEYGKDNVQVEHFYGSDFFLESEQELYDLFEKSPNTIERKNILMKISGNRNRFNRERKERESILYQLMPFVSDKDFETANAKGMDETTFLMQIRFNYWIGLFEAKYGDIVQFWNSTETSDAEKIILITNLVSNFIKDYAKESKINGNVENNAIPATAG